MDVNRNLQAFETESFGHKRITLVIRTSIVIDPYLNIPEDFIAHFIAHALCDNLREYVNSSVISEDIVKVINKPIQCEKESN